MKPALNDRECGIPNNPHDWAKPRPTGRDRFIQTCLAGRRQHEIFYNPATGREETAHL